MGIKQKGSATVEALLILPVVLFFILSVGWMADIIGIHSELGGVVNRVGNGMVIYSHAYNSLTEENIGETEFGPAVMSIGLSEGYLRSEIVKTRAGEKITDLVCAFSSITDEEIHLSVTYKVEPPMKIPGFNGIFLKNSFYSRPYTGYHHDETEDSDEDDEIVYITRTGTVYHTVTDCRALKVTVDTVGWSQISVERNNDGAKYYPCEKCAGSGQAGMVFITPYGNRYHFDRDCHEINSVWYAVPHSKVKERRKCKFCP